MASRHGTFYFDDGDVIFLVETTLFKVHRDLFIRKSDVFQTMFTLPVGEGIPAEGASDNLPVDLTGAGTVSAFDFALFLSALYSTPFGDLASSSQWSSVLQLASLWDFQSITSLAVERLNHLLPSLSPIERLTLASKHPTELPPTQWLLASYVSLATRPQPLSLQEGRTLGLETIILLAQAREAVKAIELAPEADDMFDDVYYGQRLRSPLEERQCVWDAVADVFGLTADGAAATTPFLPAPRPAEAQPTPPLPPPPPPPPQDWWNIPPPRRPTEAEGGQPARNVVEAKDPAPVVSDTAFFPRRIVERLGASIFTRFCPRFSFIHGY